MEIDTSGVGGAGSGCAYPAGFWVLDLMHWQMKYES